MLQLIKKSSGEGIVCAVNKGRVIVTPASLYGGDAGETVLSPNRTKNGCAAAGCGSCGGCAPADRRFGGFSVSVGDASRFRPGDRVQYVRYVPEPNLTSLLTFGTPVIFVLAAIFYVTAAAPRSAGSMWTFIAGTFAFAAGIAVVTALDRLFKIKFPSSIINNAEAAQ